MSIFLFNGKRIIGKKVSFMSHVLIVNGEAIPLNQIMKIVVD